jgi:hypothetical protein
MAKRDGTFWENGLREKGILSEKFFCNPLSLVGQPLSCVLRGGGGKERRKGWRRRRR